MKIADAFYSGKTAEAMFARTARDTSIQNSRALKAKGDMGWILNEHTYKRYLDLAPKYELLALEEPHEKPVVDPTSKRKLARRKARLIGPGRALAAVRDQWLPLYNRSRVSIRTLAIAI